MNLLKNSRIAWNSIQNKIEAENKHLFAVIFIYSRPIQENPSKKQNKSKNPTNSMQILHSNLDEHQEINSTFIG